MRARQEGRRPVYSALSLLYFGFEKLIIPLAELVHQLA